MAKLLRNEIHRSEHTRDAERVDWLAKVSDHVAYALLVYTGLHIFVTMAQLKTEGSSLLPYFALIVLVVAIVPALRWVEMRWEKLVRSDPGEATLAALFRREMGLLWVLAIGLPLALTFGFKAVASLF